MYCISHVYTYRALQDQIDLLQKSNRKLEAELDDKRIDYEKFKVIFNGYYKQHAEQLTLNVKSIFSELQKQLLW